MTYEYAYLTSRHVRTNGLNDTFHTWKASVKHKPLAHHIAGRQYTASGYGKRIPTEYMVWGGSRWHRIYCCIYSNSGTLYVGEWNQDGGEFITVDNFEGIA